MPDTGGQIALIGDIHSSWSREDVAYFDQSTYPLLLVTGDLGGSQARDGLSVARSMAELSRRTLVMPGNNDVEQYARIAAELTYRRGRVALLDELDAADSEPAALNGERDAAQATALDDAVGPTSGVRTCGYSAHPLQLGSLAVTIIAARPFAMGGGELSFPEALERSFGVHSLEESAERLRALVEAAPTEHLVFFAHHGPYGLGDARDELWGRDFHPDAGDWGDRDLQAAIEHALHLKRRPLAVLAGHMHWRLRGGGERRWQLQRDRILYVNAARVPRIVRGVAGVTRSHIAVTLSECGAHAEEILVPSAERSSMEPGPRE